MSTWETELCSPKVESGPVFKKMVTMAPEDGWHVSRLDRCTSAHRYTDDCGENGASRGDLRQWKGPFTRPGGTGLWSQLW